MSRLSLARLLATALRAATLAASEPDQAMAAAYVDAGTEALLEARAGADGTAYADAVEREARRIGEQLVRAAEVRMPA